MFFYFCQQFIHQLVWLCLIKADSVMNSTVKLSVVQKGEFWLTKQKDINSLWRLCGEVLFTQMDERKLLKVGTNCYYCLHWLLKHPENMFTVKQEENSCTWRGGAPLPLPSHCYPVLHQALELPLFLYHILFYPAENITDHVGGE